VSLDQLEPGTECRIKRLFYREKISSWLVVLGIYTGTRLRVVSNTPGQDRMEVEIDGCSISIEHGEARGIEVGPV